ASHQHTHTCFIIIFFFQAEDGIRDFHVTGVQTCALPISKQASSRLVPEPLAVGIAKHDGGIGARTTRAGFLRAATVLHAFPAYSLVGRNTARRFRCCVPTRSKQLFSSPLSLAKTPPPQGQRPTTIRQP